MDIGIVCDELSFVEHGGSNYSIHRLATELSDRGHDVSVHTLNLQYQNNPPDHRSYEIVEESIDSITAADAVLRLLARIDRIAEGNDLLHCYMPGIAPIFGLWRRRGGDTPVISHLNNYTPFCSNHAKMKNGCWKDCTMMKKIEHAPGEGIEAAGEMPRIAFNNFFSVPLMNHCDALLALSPAVAEIYEDVGIREEKIHVLPNMLDPTFGPAQRLLADGPPNPETIRVLYAGRTDTMKGVDILCQAISKLPDKLDYHVDIVGDDILDKGGDAADHRRLADGLGISDRMTCHGWVDYSQLPDFYDQADIFVHPGRWPEPFGRTLLEALQWGCAVVSSNTGAPPWVVGDAGVTFERGNPHDLAAQLHELIVDDAYRQRLQDNTESELQRFQPSRVVRDVESLYRSVARGS